MLLVLNWVASVTLGVLAGLWFGQHYHFQYVGVAVSMAFGGLVGGLSYRPVQVLAAARKAIEDVLQIQFYEALEQFGRSIRKHAPMVLEVTGGAMILLGGFTVSGFYARTLTEKWIPFEKLTGFEPYVLGGAVTVAFILYFSASKNELRGTDAFGRWMSRHPRFADMLQLKFADNEPRMFLWMSSTLAFYGLVGVPATLTFILTRLLPAIFRGVPAVLSRFAELIATYDRTVVVLSIFVGVGVGEIGRVSMPAAVMWALCVGGALVVISKLVERFKNSRLVTD